MAEEKIPEYPNLNVAQVEAELNTEFQSLKSGYDTAKADRMKFYREYKFQKYGNETAGASSIVDSSIWDAVEWMVPAMIQPFMETSNFIKVKPEESDFVSILRAQAHEELMAYQVKKRTNLYQVLYDLLKGMLIQRESYLKLTWQKRDKKNNEPASRPLLTVCPAAQIRYDWMIEDFEQSRVVTQEEDMTRSDLLEMMEGQKGLLKSCFEQALSESGRNHETSRLRDEEIDQPNYVGQDDDKMNKDHTLYLRREQWTTYSVDGSGITVPVLAVFIDDKLVQFTKNPYPIQRPPFFRAQCIRDVLGNPAQSIAEVLGPIQQFKTGIMRMMSDNLNAQLNGLVEYDQNNVDDIGVQLLRRAPRGSRVPIPVNKPGSVNPLPVVPIASHAYTTWELLEVAKENRSGFTRYSQGQDSKSLNQTATGIVEITSRSEMRMWEFTMRFAETVIKPLARAIIAFNQSMLEEQDLQLQFGVPEYRIRTADGREVVREEKKAGDWLTLSKKDLGGYFTVEIDIDIGADKQQQLDNAFQWAQFFGPLAGQGVPPEAIGVVALNTAKLMGLDQVQALMKKEVKTIGGGGITVPESLAGTVDAGATGPVAGEAAAGAPVADPQAEPGLPGADLAGVLDQIPQ